MQRRGTKNKIPQILIDKIDSLEIGAEKADMMVAT
jgi:hypothetical protein